MSEATTTEEPTCGQELAANAEVPERWRDLMRHVAGTMEAHARWVGAGGGAAAARERDGVLRVAAAYRAMADAADLAAREMKALRDLPAAPHDPARHDVAAFARAMAAKIAMQRQLAALLARHADESACILAALPAVR